MQDPGPIETVPMSKGIVLLRRPSPHIEWVEVDGEVVAWNEDAESLHLLDKVAALIFQLCDGVSTLGETIGDLADLFGRDPTELEPDVLACAGALAGIGMVEDVR